MTFETSDAAEKKNLYTEKYTTDKKLLKRQIRYFLKKKFTQDYF